VTWTTRVCSEDPASNGDPACIETVSTCHIKLLCVYGILDFKYETHKTRLRFILSKKYTYWAYFCHNWHRLDTRLVMETRILFETRLVLEVIRYFVIVLREFRFRYT